jgi:hypothetical protein
MNVTGYYSPLLQKKGGATHRNEECRVEKYLPSFPIHTIITYPWVSSVACDSVNVRDSDASLLMYREALWFSIFNTLSAGVLARSLLLGYRWL